MSQLPDFKYHSMFKRLQFTHLIVVDDLMIFCKGNLNSVNRLMETLTHFSVVIGLEAKFEEINCLTSWS